MLNVKRIFLVLIALVALGLPSLAQERKGGISGHVTDNSGGVLQGARIELQPLGTSIASNAQGQFFINDLDPGSLTVSITYVGFKEFTKQVTVVSGQTATVDVKLEVGSQNLEVLVTAERASAEAGQVNREITSANIVQVHDAEAIRNHTNVDLVQALVPLPYVC